MPYAVSKLRSRLAFRKGVQKRRQGDHLQAADSFKAARDVAPDLAMRCAAGRQLVDCLAAAGRSQQVVEALNALVALDPADAAAWTDLARAYDAQGHRDEAAQAWRKAAALRPDSLELQQALTTVEARAGDFTKAAVHARALVEAVPNDPDRWEALAELHAQAGDAPAAVSAWREVLRLDRTRRRAHEALIGLYSGAKQFGDAAAHARHLAEAEPGQAAAWARVAELSSRGGDNEAAVAAWTRAVRITPDDPTIHAKLIKLHGQAGRDKQALVHRRALAELSPHDAPVWRALAKAMEQRGDDAGATEAWRRVLAIGETPADVHQALVVLLERQSRTAELVPHLEALAWNSPEDASAWLRLADAYEAMGDLKRTTEALLAALKRTDDPAVSRRLIDLYIRLEQRPLAVLHLERQSRSTPKDESVWSHWAAQEEALGGGERAIEIWRQALAQNPQSRTAHAELARLFHDRNDSEAALPHLTWLSERSPNDAKLRRRLARALQAAGEVEAAIEAWRAVLAHSSQDGEANQALAALVRDPAEALVHQGVVALASKDIRLVKTHARSAQSAGARDHVIAVWRHALTLAPDDYEAHRELAALLDERERFDEALTHVEKLADLAPDDVRLRRRLSRDLARLGRIDAAVRALEAIFDIENLAEEGRHRALADLYEEFGEDHRALAPLRWLAEFASGDRAFHWARLARALGRIGDDDGEIEAWRTVLHYQPDEAKAHVRLAELLLQNNLPAQATPHLEHLIEREEDNPKHWQRLARAVQKWRSPQEAVAVWERVLRLRPDDLEAHEAMVRNLDSLGRPAAAEAHLRFMAEAKPDALEIWQRLAPTSGDVEAEIRWWQRILAITPNDRFLLERLALFLYGVGRKDDAAPYFKRLAERDPQSALGWRRLARCLTEIGRDAEAKAALATASMAEAVAER